LNRTAGISRCLIAFASAWPGFMRGGLSLINVGALLLVLVALLYR
jgi:TRAP-type C4-dicarboxylate transport system permease large subunit